MTVIQRDIPVRNADTETQSGNGRRHFSASLLEPSRRIQDLRGERIGVAGCGPGGAIAALFAANLNANVTVFDPLHDERVVPADEKRSFSLTLSCEFVDSFQNRTVGGRSLRGIGEAIKQRGQRIIGRKIYWPDGRQISTDYGMPERDAFYAIPRNSLSQLLKNDLEACENPILVRNRWRVDEVDAKSKTIVARNLHCDSGDRCAIKTFEFDRVIDASGLHSSIRAALNQRCSSNYSRKVSKEVYVSLHINANSALSAGLPSDRLLIWYGVDSSFAIGVPQRSGDVDVLFIGNPKEIQPILSSSDPTRFHRLHPTLAAIGSRFGWSAARGGAAKILHSVPIGLELWHQRFRGWSGGRGARDPTLSWFGERAGHARQYRIGGVYGPPPQTA